MKGILRTTHRTTILTAILVLIAPRSHAEPLRVTQQEAEVAAPGVWFADEQDRTRDNEDIVVTAPHVEIPVPAPRGESRSMSERMESRGAWDRCALSAQSALDADPFGFQEEAPEESCSRALGMSDRDSRPRR